MYRAQIYITLKESVLDPQGQAVQNALHHMGKNEVEGVRIGKYIEIKLNAPDQNVAGQMVDDYCKTLLANTVIEQYRFDIEELK